MGVHSSIFSTMPKIENECTACLHVNAIVIYCEICCQTLCDSCLINGNHRNHSYLTLTDAVKNQMEEIQQQSKKVTFNINKYHDINARVSTAERELQEMYDETKKNISDQYRELQTLVERNEQRALVLLKAEGQCLKQGLTQLAEDGHGYQRSSADMLENINTLRTRQKIESPAILLEEIERLGMSLETMKTYYSTLNKQLRCDGTRMTGLQASVQKLFEKNKEIIPRPWEFSETITFDEDKKHKDLLISEDKTQITLLDSSTRHSKPTVTSANILASQRFTGGQHYWEVDVRGCQNWTVGVAESDWVKNGVGHPLGRDKRSWVLESDDGQLSALHHKDVSTIKEANIQRLGVFMDYAKGRLRFYDVSTGSVLHTFITCFKQSLCPAFSLRAQANSSAHLLICRLIPREMHYGSAEGSIDSGACDIQDEEHIESANPSL